ncbi:hypothetical protein ACPYIV_03940 [Parabacteroides sp. ASD2025]|uniref:hypothetical protein n=1 Tax=Parabacteroides sp. ASD2025 TaxID=3415987 RepID=UPI003CE79ECA
MYKTQRKILLSYLLIPFLLAGCDTKQGEETKRVQAAAHTECNAVYYWKTTYNLSDGEKVFLQKHRVGRMYIRFFDVVMDVNPMTSGLDAVPNATIRFQEQPDSTLEIVPTVYITLEALKLMKDAEDEYASKIVNRVFAMINANHVKNVKEVQLDCDWTKSTEESYFCLCREVREKFHHWSVDVSATIRLHQLWQNEPPVDRGVLMLYNTGNIRSSKVENSILSREDVRPYLRGVLYGLHLDFAYPTFGWGVWFRENEFQAILDWKKLSDYSQSRLFRQKGGSDYVVVEDFYDYVISASFKKNDRIRIEKPSFREIMYVKNLVNREWGKTPHSCILYHLDSLNLSDYSTNEIEAIFCTD